MEITKEIASNEFEKLIGPDRQTVINILMDVRNRYIMSGFQVDLPYFFYSMHKKMFRGDEHKDFLDIKDSNVFTIYAIYYISRFILETRGGTTNES